MDESQNNQIALKDIITLLMEKLDAQMGYTRSIQERLDRIEKGVVEGLLNPLAEAQDKFEFEDWKEAYGKPLERFEKATKAIEGGDFDIYRSAYDESRKLDDDSQEEFIQRLSENLEQQITALRNGLDLPPNTDIEIKSDNSGDVDVSVNGQSLEEAGNSEPQQTETEEVQESPLVAQKRAETEATKAFNEKLDNPSSDNEVDEELEQAFNKYKNSKWR